MRKKTGYLSLCLLAILPGCGSKKVSRAAFEKEAALSITTNIDVSSADIEYLREQQQAVEAQLQDIPMVLGSMLVRHEREALQPDQEVVVLATWCTKEEILNFYRAELARLGWRLNLCVEGQESYLVFEKPYKTFLITISSLKTSKKSTFSHLIHLVISPKASGQ